MVDHIADMLNTLKTHEMLGQRECTVKATKLTRSILEIFKTHGYLRDYDFWMIRGAENSVFILTVE